MKYAVKSVVGRVRSNNQDFYHVPRPGAGPDNLFIVADGMAAETPGRWPALWRYAQFANISIPTVSRKI